LAKDEKTIQNRAARPTNPWVEERRKKEKVKERNESDETSRATEREEDHARGEEELTVQLST